MRIAHAVLLVLPLLANCTMPRDEGRRFRDRLPVLTGQPIQLVFDELGEIPARPADGNRLYTWEVVIVGTSGVGCRIDITADMDDRIRRAAMTGSDYDCGEMLVRERRRTARYRADPALKAREEAEARLRLDELVRLRQALRDQPSAEPRATPQ